MDFSCQAEHLHEQNNSPGKIVHSMYSQCPLEVKCGRGLTSLNFALIKTFFISLSLKSRSCNERNCGARLYDCNNGYSNPVEMICTAAPHPLLLQTLEVSLPTLRTRFSSNTLRCCTITLGIPLKISGF